MDARSFLKQLHEEVAEHPGVGHSLLGRMDIDPRSRTDFKTFAGQHYALVFNFTRYLELLLIGAPNSQSKVWLAKVLVDEYGERSHDLDHAEHYGIFMKACGWGSADLDNIRLHPAVTGFIAEHIRLCTERPFLVGLGAVGPGHEWAIPTMFDYCLRGLKAAGFSAQEYEYFDLHCEQDIDHGAWLEEALANLCDSEQAQDEIREGCLASLAAREKLWWGLADKITAAKMQERFAHMPSAASATAGSDEAELTLHEFMQQMTFSHVIPATHKELSD
ncbi:MAG: iron-containing redox enzyme family protein [Planctomycetes bacterium]|nr:iron-containing redox enzyme family protein [Planctomycetota bacterium]